MLNGLYVATSGLLMQEKRVAVLSNNIANANTTGFKKEIPVFSDHRPVDNRFPQNSIQKTYYNKTINSVVKLDEINTDFESGFFKVTDNRFDFALENEDNFFTIETPFGLRYTRDGTFTLNDFGELVTKDGFNILDDQGTPILIPDNTLSLDVTLDGSILADGVFLSKIGVVTFSDKNYLQKVGNNLYAAVNILPEVPNNPSVRQGFLESSNVDPVNEMVQMIDALRGFELFQKVVHTIDELNEQTATQIGKLQ